MEICVFGIILYFNSYKTVSRFIKEPNTKIPIFLVQETIKWIYCVVHYLSMKMKEKSVEIIDLQLFSSLE